MKKILSLIFKPETLKKTIIFILLFVIPIILMILGYFEPIKEFFDSESLTFKLGKFTFSIYEIFKIILALIILFWSANIISSSGEKRLWKLKKIKASNKALLVKGFQSFVYAMMFLIGLNVLGIDLSALAMVGGAVGIGVGFGLQNITSNFISGLILLFEKSVEEGDLLELTDGTVGFVRHTGARYTLIETFENSEIMIPNEYFITNRVTNWTFSDTQGRVAVDVAVSYSSDLDKVFNLIMQSATEYPRCSKKIPPECYLVDFADSSVKFTLFFWVEDVVKGRKSAKSDVLFSIWRKFKENNIKIPFPQRDLHIKESEEIQKN